MYTHQMSLNLYIHKHRLQIIGQCHVREQHWLDIDILHMFKSDADTHTFKTFLKGLMF